MKDFLDIALPIFFGAAMIFALFKLVQKKGFMGMLFNAEILETIGEVGSEKDNTFKTAVKVHVLKGENSNLKVGAGVIAPRSNSVCICNYFYFVAASTADRPNPALMGGRNTSFLKPI